MKKFLLLTSTMFFVLFVFAQKLPFQGKLFELGWPVNGIRNIEVKLPDLLWSEVHTGVQITNGLYFIVLGSNTPLPANLFNGVEERQLMLSVDGTPLSPVTLYRPLASGLDSLYLKGSGNGSLKGGFIKGSAVNENLPYLKLNGNLSNTFDRISLGISSNQDNSIETGNISVSSTNGLNNYFSPGYLALNHNDTASLSLFSQNWGNKGFSGTILLRGPKTINFEIGSKHWENADLPQLQMRGTASQTILYLSGEKYQDAGVDKEMAQMTFFDSDDKNVILNPSQFSFHDAAGNRAVSIRGTNHGSNKIQGLFELFGNNSPEPFKRTAVISTEDWGNGDFGKLELFGVNSNVLISNGINENKAEFGMSGNDNLSARLRMAGPDAHIALEEELHSSNPPKVFLDIENHGNGNFGRLVLNSDGGTSTTYKPGGLSSSVPFAFENGVIVKGDLIVTGNLSTNTSDHRLKKDIQPLGNNTLKKIAQIGGYSYFWRKEEFPQKHFSESQQIGLIAQELEEQFPALVKTGDDGFKSVNYNGFTAVLLEAVKELNAKVEKLELENNHLHAEISASANKSEEMDGLKKQVDFLTKLVQEKIAETEKTAGKN